jgi:acetyl-CoA acetyltransferase
MTSRGWDPWTERPLPEVVRVAYPRSILLIPSTELTKVTRTRGVAPSGWIGDYVTTQLAPSQLKPGDFVAVTASLEKDGPQALKITVVEIGER